VKFCRSREKAIEFLSGHRIKDFVPLKEHLSLILLKPKKLEEDKIIQSGFTVLEYAKQIFYEGYYQQLKKVFGERCSMAYMDTDSAVCYVHDPQKTFLEDIINHKDFFDFSKVSSDCDLLAKNPELVNLNAGVSGKWKIESIDISEAVFLKSKQYALKYFGKSNELKCKGIPSASLRQCSTDTYKAVLEDEKIVRLDMNCIRSLNHKLFNMTVNKIAFHYLDVNRVYYSTEDRNLSLPFFHHKLHGCDCNKEMELE